MTAEMLGKYEIIELLGSGATSEVYRARDTMLGREVALKVLKAALVADASSFARFAKEAQAAGNLFHPNIATVLDMGESQGRFFIAMRYFSGQSLDQLLKVQGRLSWAETLRMAQQIGSALDFAHKQGLLHRDVKPANILFTTDGDFILTDFGLTRAMMSTGLTSHTGAVLGTPAYIAPEVWLGEPAVPATDQYALACVVSEVLSGKVLYAGETPPAVMTRHVLKGAELPSAWPEDVPEGLGKVLARALAKTPGERYASLAEFVQALEGLQESKKGMAVKSVISNDAKMASRVAISDITGTGPSGNRPGTQPVSDGKLKIKDDAGLIKIGLASPKSTSELPPSGSNQWRKWAVIGGILVIGVGAIFFLGLIGLGVFFVGRSGNALLAKTETPTITSLSTFTAVPLPTFSQPIATLAVTIAAATAAPSATTVPVAGVSIGGADKLAFLQSNEVWIMNLDGSGLKLLTNNKLPKTNLQWIPGTNKLVFISGPNVNMVDSDTGNFDTLMSFGITNQINEFRISPDGKQVAIGLNREMYIVPFDLAELKAVTTKDELIAMKGCLSYSANNLTNIHLKAFRWSRDGKIAAWLFQGSDSAGKIEDLIRVTDISTCNPARLNTSDEFPGTRFTPKGFENNPILPAFDWDGISTFVMNTFDSNAGWGFLYIYSSDLHKGSQENPIASAKSRCCYRDPAWSPDGTFLFFAFQNKDDPNSPEQFYYVPVASLQTGTGITPIPMPDGFFINNKAPISPALHFATP